MAASEVYWTSNKAYWWRCPDCDHEEKTSPGHRERRKAECLACAQVIASPQLNLTTEEPDLILEWHPTKNRALDPTSLTRGSKTIVWWKCEVCRHAWRASVNERTNRSCRHGCPACAGSNGSRVEIQAWWELSKLLPLSPRRQRLASTGGQGLRPDLVVDLAVPGGPNGLVIEYDGSQWHTDEVRDRAKNMRYQAAGYRVIRVREEPLTPIGEDDITVSVKQVYGAAWPGQEVVAALIPALRRLTGRNIEYTVEDPPLARREAIEDLRDEFLGPGPRDERLLAERGIDAEQVEQAFRDGGYEALRELVGGWHRGRCRRLMDRLGIDRMAILRERRASGPGVSDPRLLDESWLRAEYVDRHRTTGDIGCEIGVSGTTVLYALRRFGIPRRHVSAYGHKGPAARPVAVAVAKDLADLAANGFDEKGFVAVYRGVGNVSDLARKVGIAKSRCVRVLTHLGVERSGKADPRLADAGWLREAYEVQGRSQTSIAEECGVTQPAVRRWLDVHGIARR